MKTYIKLPIPKDSAWDRKTWRRYVNWRISHFLDGIWNLITWLPVIWQDRNWDGYYITKLLQKKIELQRAYLIKHNRHTQISRDNYWMTLILNLIEREHEGYYECEYQKYAKYSSDVFWQIESHRFDEFLHKYPASTRRVMQKFPNKEFNSESLALYVSMYNQQRCRKLIFEILKRHSAEWWD
jgi:hypothetical protein